MHLFQQAVAGGKPSRVPVWLMRQAGRYDPAYQQLKRQSGLALGELFRHPQLAAEISLLPRAIGVDALIIFQDILTILAPMGAEFVYDPKPRLRSFAAGQLPSLHPCDVADAMPFVAETLRLVQAESSLPLLGFAGAPLTLAVFLVEGGSFGRAQNFRRFMQEQPRQLHVLLALLADHTRAYLQLQVEAGAAAVQLFESAAELFSIEEYQEFALPYQQRALADQRAATIIFAKNFYDLSLLQRSGATVISLPAGISISSVRQQLGAKTVVQGNISNRLLVQGSKAMIKQAVQECIAASGGRGHILNLDHGILPATSYEKVRHLVACAALGASC
ncbi:MAG: uroporphyrinogen decarboxylase [Pseudomonadota bacterium]|nr:uroporphyrinogen decarboxylase [Pseudomonadota bacterium]